MAHYLLLAVTSIQPAGYPLYSVKFTRPFPHNYTGSLTEQPTNARNRFRKRVSTKTPICLRYYSIITGKALTIS